MAPRSSDEAQSEELLEYIDLMLKLARAKAIKEMTAYKRDVINKSVILS